MKGGARTETASGNRTPRPGSEERSHVSVLEQTLWRRLSDSSSREAFAEAWLNLQCRMIARAVSGIVLLRAPDTAELVPAAFWPEAFQPSPAVGEAVRLAASERRGVVQGGSGAARDGRADDAAIIAYPVLVDDEVHGIVVVELDGTATPDLRAAMRQLQWGVAWLRDRVRKQVASDKDHILERTTTALDLVASALEQEGFLPACRNVATELAIRGGCDRVSIGFRNRGTASVSAVSHSAQFGKRMSLLRALAAAMDEAIDQRMVILFPPSTDEEAVATRAHSELAHAHRAGHVLTVPLLVDDRHVGAAVFERPADRPFDEDDIDLLECAASVLGPILEEKRQNDRWLIAKAWHVVGNQTKRLLGPGHVRRKLLVAGALAAVTFFYFATALYRVTADATIEGAVQRAVIAPFDGFIKEAPTRAGDTVEAGTLLAALDDRDFVLERLKWVTERQKRVFEHDRAVAARDRAEIKIVKAQIEQAEAQIRLIDEQLRRATLHAPLAGLVVSGDLSQSIGGAVSRGDVLFEIAPLDAYRVVLMVPESQIADVEPGQPGQLIVSSLPHAPFPFVVETITPVARAFEGVNTFRVEASLTEQSPRLRPGMKGIGKIEVEERRLIWIWSRAMMDWLRLFAWRWLP